MTPNQSVLSFQYIMLCSAIVLSGSSTWASDPTGVWRGEWRSASTGHHGPMRVAIRPSADGTYRATFTGRFAVVIPFVYGVSMSPSSDLYGNTQLEASKQLGPLIGSYRMQTTFTGSSLRGGFQAAKDRGTITMRRVR